jgi:hypothetical protein
MVASKILEGAGKLKGLICKAHTATSQTINNTTVAIAGRMTVADLVLRKLSKSNFLGDRFAFSIVPCIFSPDDDCHKSFGADCTKAFMV